MLDYEFVPPHDPWLNPWTRMPAPDVLGYSRQEFGNRVGFWRVLELFDKHKIRPTAVVNVDALKLYPDITRAIRERRLGHSRPRHVQHSVSSTTTMRNASAPITARCWTRSKN